ncbi:hypothetical protein KL925_004355 [Ogataea polymorpha]|nr:hypothetical protein KL925_004355 [Ogataea polymorpha]
MLLLERITDFEVLRYVLSHNHRAWGGTLGMKEYIERERLNYTHRFCDLWRDDTVVNGTYYWVFRDTTLPSDKFEDIVCACEFVVRDSYYFDKSLHEGKCAAVGSVYTLEQHRKKGYATKMMEQLVEKMKGLFQGKYDFSFLYSEVGEYYSRFGFQSYHVPLALLETGRKTAIPYLYVTEENLPKFIDQYDAKVRRMVQASSGSVAVKPSVENLEWFQNRSIHLAKLQKREFNGNRFGIYIGSAFALWYYEFGQDQVTLIMLDAETLDQTRKLLECCMAECSAVKKIKIWHDELVYHAGEYNGAALELVKELGGSVGHKNDSLSALCMLHSSTRPAWVANGKWAWY